MDRTDEQWSVVSPLRPACPKRRDGRGRPWRCNRAVLNGILWILRTGAPWHDLPDRYPSYPTCHRRFQRWSSDGPFEPILRTLAHDLMSEGDLIGANASSMACLSRRKKGGPSRSDQAGQRYEDHGRGRPRWSSYRRTHPKCFAARSHPRRSHP